jgi:hypothetical protein
LTIVAVDAISLVSAAHAAGTDEKGVAQAGDGTPGTTLVLATMALETIHANVRRLDATSLAAKQPL